MLSILGMILPNNLSNGPLSFANKAVSSLFAFTTVFLLAIPSSTETVSPANVPTLSPSSPPAQAPKPPIISPIKAPGIAPTPPKADPIAAPAAIPPHAPNPVPTPFPIAPPYPVFLAFLISFNIFLSCALPSNNSPFLIASNLSFSIASTLLYVSYAFIPPEIPPAKSPPPTPPTLAIFPAFDKFDHFPIILLVILPPKVLGKRPFLTIFPILNSPFPVFHAPPSPFAP